MKKEECQEIGDTLRQLREREGISQAKPGEELNGIEKKSSSKKHFESCQKLASSSSKLQPNSKKGGKMLTPNERREAIIQYLFEVHYSTCFELSEIFGVGKRTIWRDIEQLTCKYGIECIPGNKGGIYLAQCQSVPKNTLSEEQINWLLSFCNHLDVTDENSRISFSILEKFSPWRAQKLK